MKHEIALFMHQHNPLPALASRLSEAMTLNHRVVRFSHYSQGDERRSLYLVPPLLDDNVVDHPLRTAPRTSSLSTEARLGVALVAFLAISGLAMRESAEQWGIQENQRKLAAGRATAPTISQLREQDLRISLREKGLKNVAVRGDIDSADFEITEPLSVYFRDLPSQEAGNIVGYGVVGQTVRIGAEEIVELNEAGTAAIKYWRPIEVAGRTLFMATADSKERNQCFGVSSNPYVEVC